MRDPTARDWLMLWAVMGRPRHLPSHRMRALPMEVFQHAERVECIVEENVSLSVLKLYNDAGKSAHNFLVTLRIRHPERKRHTCEEYQHQYPEARVPEAIVEALDQRIVSPA
jgi:hypothetical protein